MAYTAKSVVLDIADNYGSTSYMGVRAIDFWFEGSKVANLVTTDFVAYGTSQFSISYKPEFSFDTSKSKTGTYLSNQWISGNTQNTNQRIICVFNSPLEFDKIVINNSHHNGTTTDTGAKNVVINVSSDNITDTTYNAAISNSTLAYSGTFDEHVGSDVVDDQILILESDGIVSGVVTEESVAVARTVRAYDRSDGAFVAETVSSAVDGAYSMNVGTASEVFVIAFDDAAGTQYNAVILDNITPI